MNISKVLNDGKHLTQSNNVITFLTLKGCRKPQYIYVGYSNDNIEMCAMTKKSCISAIERDNRLFNK